MSTQVNVSQKIRTGGSPLYNYQKERIDILNEIDPGNNHKSLYDQADALSEARRFNPASLDLDGLAKEIKVRVKITQREIFIMGELFWIAKSKCKQEGTSFMTWVEDKCDFSYSKANNCMKVYKYCFSMMRLALNVPISILYKVSEPKFPDELRVYLFEQGGLEKIKNKKLMQLKEKYDKGGIEAIEQEMEGFAEAKRIQAQIRNTRDQFENAFRTLAQAKENMEKGRDRFPKDFEDEIENHHPDAKALQRLLFGAVSQAYEIMDEANSKI